MKKQEDNGRIDEKVSNMGANENLHKAKKAKNDEFYTRYEDIAKEMERYKDKFRDKVVYCNCDSENSNFYKFFRDHFDEWGLKRVICTHYEPKGRSYATIIDRDDVTEPFDLEKAMKNTPKHPVTLEDFL